MWCGGAPGYFPRPPTPTISSPFSFFWTTQHEYNNTQHPWEAHPAWDSNPADLAVVSEECRSSSTTLPSTPDRHHTHPWPGGGFFLRKNPPPSVGFNPLAPGPRHRSTVSHSHAATELEKANVVYLSKAVDLL
jgi:hypothetical protein